MTQPAKSHEPSMEEILASIRRIIADDDVKPEPNAAAAEPTPAPRPASVASKTMPPNTIAPAAAKPPTTTAAKPPPTPAAKPPEPKPSAAPAAPAVSNNQDDIDALLAGLDADTSEAEVRASNESPPGRDNDVLELTEAHIAAAEPAQQNFRTIQPADDLEFTDTKRDETRGRERSHGQVPTSARSLDQRETPIHQSLPQQSLMSSSTMSAVNSAFNSLAQTVLSNNARTLEDLVKEMLRPMLKGWLDDNLPGLVEKIVRAEIERVSRGR